MYLALSLESLVAAALAALVGLAVAWAIRGKFASRARPLPTHWALTARPVFNTEERRLYRMLREALPHHIVLAKLPLVRFCQPLDPKSGRYWYELLGTHHVTFAVCSANGRVLAAIDLEDRSHSRRMIELKHAVLDACRVQYLRCPSDHLPSAAELQLLVPQSSVAAVRAPQPAVPALNEARNSLASTVAHRRAERTALWQDSTFFQDSFFAPDSRFDGFGGSDFSSLVERTAAEGNDRAASPTGRPAQDDSRPDGGLLPQV